MAEETGTDLITLPSKEELPAYFKRDGGIEELVSKIEAEAGKVEHDVSTAKGRKAARSFASKVSKSKTVLEDVRKSITEEWRQKTAEVNARGKVAVERLDALRDKIKKPADDYEQKEADRQAKHMRALDQFDLEQLDSHAPSFELKALIERIEAVEINDSWEEFEGDAREQKAAALTKFKSDLGIAEQREAQERELEELRKEKAEREAKEAEEAAKAAEEAAAKAAEEQRAKEKADAEQKAREEAEAAAKAREERLAREKEEAEERHKQELAAEKRKAEEAAAAERKRIADEKRAAEEAEAQRKADAEHRKAITAEIVAAITAAKPRSYEHLIDMMIDGEIPHVKVAV
ncbi:hypothetical protein [Tritonibacter mobilis]|uniref:hypothetical protein n=1 Tax=Tritonibacter mobilis TaxID=379347 RepID=UPI000806AB32|nr:hypothetical protein [Tritonibacter mobilis]